MVVIGNREIVESLYDRGLKEVDFGWPLDLIKYATAACERGWALVSYRPGKLTVESPDGDRITVRAIDPLLALRSLPNERTRARS